MANIKITDLTAYTDPLNTDVLPIVDVTSDTTKKVSIADLLKNASAGTAAAPGIAFDGDNTGIYSPGADQVAISTNGTGRLFIASDGKILAGQSAVLSNATGQRLELTGDIVVNTSTTGTGAEAGLNFYQLTSLSTATRACARIASISTGSYTAGNGTTNDADLAIQTSLNGTLSERLRIDSSGRLGLGTSSPSAKLDVNGDVRITSDLTIDVDTTAFGGIAFKNNNTGTSGYWRIAGDADGDLKYERRNSGGGFVSAPFNVSSTGVASFTNNVGIGTTTVGQKLTVNGDAKITNLGLGINPTTGRTLEVESSSSAAIRVRNASAASGAYINFWDNSTVGANQNYFGCVGNNFIFNQNGTERARLDNAGRLLVGTSSSSSNNSVVIEGYSGSNTGQGILTLAKGSSTPADGNVLGAIEFTDSGHVASASVIGRRDGGTWTSGSSQPSRLVFSTTADGASSPTARMTIKNDGRVGIGVASPNERLDVRGKLYLNNGSASYFDAASSNGLVITNPTAVRWEVNSAERARLDSSGRLLVGTSAARNIFSGASPAFQVEGTNQSGGFATIFRNGTVAGQPATLGIGRSKGSALGSVAALASGDYIGRVSFFGADGTGTVNAAEISAYVDGTPGANDMPGRLVFSTTADGSSSPTERMRVGNDGDVLIGATTLISQSTSTGSGVRITKNGQQISIADGSPAFFIGRNTSDGNSVDFRRAGVQVGTISVTASGTAYNTSSDYRLKENVVPLTGAADRLNELQVHRFNFIADPGKTVDGFIAHEAQAVVPECVTGAKDAVDDEGNPVYQGIDQSKLVPLLTAALQEALAKIETLEQRLSDAGIA